MQNITEKITIEKLQKSDVDSVYELEEIVRPEHHWSKDSFYNELSNNLAVYYCIKLPETNKVIAYIGMWKIFEEAHITTLAVHPDYRRNSLASILMIQSIKECYKEMIKYITLEVRESNTPAIKLYEKFLFESIGVRKKYYQDNGENAVIMFTQNIWYDKFKNNFEQVSGEIKSEVNYDK